MDVLLILSIFCLGAAAGGALMTALFGPDPDLGHVRYYDPSDAEKRRARRLDR